jgi:hypothetical protein
MKRGQVFVRRQFANGRWGNIDALDLDDVSFRAFVLDVLFRAGAVCGLRDEAIHGEPLTYRARLFAAPADEPAEK